MTIHPKIRTVLSFLSRLLGFQTGQVQPEEETAEREQFAPAAAAPEDKPVLQLRSDHPLNKLWELRRSQTRERLPPPELRMESPKLKLLTPKEAKRELSRLQSAINSSANQRWKLAQPPKKKRGEEDAEPVAEPVLDAQVTVITTSGQMTAWVLCYPPVGDGQELSVEMLRAALDGSGVVFGLDEKLIERLPQDPKRYLRLFLVAQGRLAVNGKDGSVVDLFPRQPEQKLEADEFGQLDYTQLNLIQNVEEGGVICRIIPPTMGVPGYTVQNKELSAKDGRPATPPAGRNTEVTEDGTAVVATKTGDVKFNGRAFTVRQVMEIDGNVDYAVGSINYVGDVHVHGDVLSGFSIQAMGDITVDGVVEACTIEAGGDLVVAKGIAGSDQAIIRAHGKIFAKYLESCCVYVRSGLQTDCIMNCDVYSDSTVNVRSGRGTIIGGSIRAAEEVDAGAIGSQSELPTRITLGGLPCEEFEREVLVKELDELEEDIEKTERQPDSSVKLSQLSKMRMKVLINKKKLEQVDKELELLRSELDERNNKGRLVCDIAHRGTEITIGNATMRLNREIRPCHAKLMDGEVAFF